MSNENTIRKHENTRPLDPNVLQRRASNPQSSVWVSASAGTGKTKVLTDRVLRLLLPREDGSAGSPPHKILGITFTKAAASEMSLRITKRLSAWAVMPLEILTKDLSKLLNKKPTSLDIGAARKLFAQVVDTPGGLKIMTIHAFCQSLLGRFPLEARLPPYFSVMEDAETQQILIEAIRNVITQAQSEKTSDIAESFTEIAQIINEDQFSSLLKDVISERRQFKNIIQKNLSIDGIYNKLCQSLNIPTGQNINSIRAEACSDEAFDITNIKRALSALSQSSKKTDQEKAHLMASWLELDVNDRASKIEDYSAAFLTAKNEHRKTLATQEAQTLYPEILDVMSKEAERLKTLKETEKSIACANLTRHLLVLANNVLEKYQTLKTNAAKLDFDDLILKTHTLLNGTEFKNTNASWVLYKMDQGIDHILVDEAQDTNPDQWSIIEALCHEFFTGQGQKDITRTVFIVGDEKQSIYSFQRASPEEFSRMHSDFAQKVLNANEQWEPVDLNISFRSTRSVLQAVDAVFANPELRKGLSEKEINHQAFRSADAGRVELWPLFEPDEQGNINLWEPPTTIQDNPSGHTKLAEYIAAQISAWITNKEILESKNRPIQAGDIMVLVRSRSALVPAISRALKSKNIPVSGADRMMLNNEIIVEDLLALAKFSVLSSDDLTLAALLKSPLIAMSEQDLFDIAHTRTASLWEALQNNKKFDAISDYLEQAIVKACKESPFEFFSSILQSSCPADNKSALRAIQTRLGIEVTDPLNEFLRAAQDFEHSNIPSIQGFIYWQERRTQEIKRELEEANNQVRIMTVHASKGLQAPIVIMPDTTRTTTSPPGQIDKRLIWPDKSTLETPIWSPRKDYDPLLFTAQMSKLDERLDEEYRRLLYVAMTRAEDRLYITGAMGKKKPLENSWYYFVENGLKAIKNIENKDGILILKNPQTTEIKEKKGIKKPTEWYEIIPDYLFENAPIEPHPPAPLTPSRPSQSDEKTASPLQDQNIYRFRRGNVTHKLLEILPDLPNEKRQQAAQHYIQRFASDLDETIQSNILEETLNILNTPEFKGLFSPASRAEVPISGYLKNGTIINGQIDRLLITDNQIIIVDYKTNRPPPKTSDGIPQIYQNQMQAYADTLREIYPNKTIKAALLWTDGPYLMPVPLK